MTASLELLMQTHGEVMAWTYILRCADGSFYVGSTHDLDGRMAQHAAGAADGYTSSRLPVELMFAGEFERIDEAWAFEVRIKGWRREKKIALIEGRFTDLPELSRTARQMSATTKQPFDKLRERRFGVP